MSTPRFLRSMVRRGWLWTTGIGALLGAGYGIVLLATMMLSLGQIAPDSAILPLVLVSLYGALLSASLGAIVAGGIGFVAGPLGGLLCAGMTRLLFIPLKNAHRYRATAQFVAAVYGMAAIGVAVRLISTSGFVPPIETTRQALTLYVLPILLGGAAGAYIGPKVANC